MKKKKNGSAELHSNFSCSRGYSGAIKLEYWKMSGGFVINMNSLCDNKIK